jgi:hypothetical protein
MKVWFPVKDHIWKAPFRVAIHNPTEIVLGYRILNGKTQIESESNNKLVVGEDGYGGKYKCLHKYE